MLTSPACFNSAISKGLCQVSSFSLDLCNFCSKLLRAQGKGRGLSSWLLRILGLTACRITCSFRSRMRSSFS
jgi:hypothetical protein